MQGCMNRQLGRLWRPLVIVSISGIGEVGRLPVAMNEYQGGAVCARGPEEEPIVDATCLWRSCCSQRYRCPSARRLGHLWLQTLRDGHPRAAAGRGRGRDSCWRHLGYLGRSTGARRRRAPQVEGSHPAPPLSFSLEWGGGTYVASSF